MGTRNKIKSKEIYNHGFYCTVMDFIFKTKNFYHVGFKGFYAFFICHRLFINMYTIYTLTYSKN